MNSRLQTWRDAGRLLTVAGRRIFVRTGGNGPPLLLIHGYPVGSYDWHAVWPLLENHYFLIAPDMPGHGFSDKSLRGDYSLAAHAATHDALLGQLGITACHVVACDLGVSVVQEMLAQRADADQPRQANLWSLALLNGGLCPQAYQPRAIQRLLASPLGAWLGPRIPRSAFENTVRTLYGDSPPPSDALLDDFWTLLSVGDGRLATHRVGAFWRERLALQERLLGALLGSGLPLRLINGAADPNSGAHMVRAFRLHRPDADVVSLEGIGHWPQIQAPEPVAEALHSFLSQHTPDHHRNHWPCPH